MAVLSRLWFVLAPDPGGALTASVEALAGRPLAVLAHSDDPTSAALTERLRAAGAPAPVALAGSATAGLDALAAAHPDLELAVVAGRELLLSAVALALGQARAATLPRAGSLSAFHWPTGLDPAARVELIGLDLDWFPPWHSGQARSKFPGGPGVAGTARG